jgi:hypothetical protein
VGPPVGQAAQAFGMGLQTQVMAENQHLPRGGGRTHPAKEITRRAARFGVVRPGTGQPGRAWNVRDDSDRLVAPARATGSPDEVVVTQDWLRPARQILPIAGRGAMVKSTSGTTGRSKLRHLTEVPFLARVRRGIVLRGEAEGPVLIG